MEVLNINEIKLGNVKSYEYFCELLEYKLNSENFKEMKSDVEYNYRKNTRNLILESLKENYGVVNVEGDFTFYIEDLDKKVGLKESIFLPITYEANDYREIEVLKSFNTKIMVFNIKIHLDSVIINGGKKYKVLVNVTDLKNIKDVVNSKFASNVRPKTTIERLYDICINI